MLTWDPTGSPGLPAGLVRAPAGPAHRQTPLTSPAAQAKAWPDSLAQRPKEGRGTWPWTSSWKNCCCLPAACHPGATPTPAQFPGTTTSVHYPTPQHCPHPALLAWQVLGPLCAVVLHEPLMMFPPLFISRLQRKWKCPGCRRLWGWWGRWDGTPNTFFFPHF